VRIGEALSLDNLALAYDGAEIEYGRPMQVITADLPASYAARIPFHIPAGLRGPYYLFLRGRALAGRIGVGVLETENGEHGYPQQQKYLTPTMGATDLYIPLLAPERADTLILTNAVEEHVRSKILVEDAALVAFAKAPAEETVQVLDLAPMKAADAKASVNRGTVGLMVTARPERSSLAARLPLTLGEEAGTGLTLHVRVRLLEGNLAFGIAAADGKYLTEPRSLWASRRPLEVVLPMPSKPPFGDLIVFNSARRDVPSKGIIERIEIHRAHEQ
jgi:hypothetical protein